MSRDLNSTTVLVVDDDEAVRDSLQVMLEAKGFTVRTFPSAEAFLDDLPGPLRGCLLLDIRMTGMSGTALQESLRARGYPLPVIMLTGHGDVATAVQAMKAGAFDFIEKPFVQDVILDAIARALASFDAWAETRAVESEVSARLERLTPRERQVMEQLVEGHSNKEIARRLDVSPRTVEVYRARVMEKMGAASIARLVQMIMGAPTNKNR